MFRVGLVGLGRIGSGFDVPEGPIVQTHVKAILADRRLTLVMISDIDQEKAKKEATRFGLNIPVVAPDDLLASKLDVVCIATPDGTHLDYLSRAAAAGPRIVIVEKPLEVDGDRRRRILEQSMSKGATLVVNHTRRWIPHLSDWITSSAVGAFGAPLSATVTYNRGFRHNGVHALDLIGAFVGGVVASARQVGRSYNDFSCSDATISALVTLRHDTGEVPVFIVGVDGRVQASFDVDIRFEHARVRVFDQHGIRAELHTPQANEPAGFADELRPNAVYEDWPPRLISQVWLNIADHLSNGTALICAGKEALVAYDLADDILEALANE